MADVSQHDDSACESCGHDGTCDCTCCPTRLADLIAVQIAYWRALADTIAARNPSASSAIYDCALEAEIIMRKGGYMPDPKPVPQDPGTPIRPMPRPPVPQNPKPIR